MLLGKGNPQDDLKTCCISQSNCSLLQDVWLDTATCEVTVKIQGGQVVAHREEGADFETTVAIAGVMIRAAEDYLQDQLPAPKRRCRVRPIPVKVEWPVVTLRGDKEAAQMGEYVEPEIPVIKTEPREEAEDGQ